MRVNSISPRVAEHLLCLTKHKLKIVQVCAPIAPFSEEDITSFYNDNDETLGKTNHYNIVMGDFDAQIGKSTNGNDQVWARIEKRKTLVKWTTSRKYKIMNTMFLKKAGRRLTWKSPNGGMKAEIDYILTNRPDIVTYVTVINHHVNIRSDHRTSN